MIEIVINYDPTQKVFKLYEPTTDTLLITASLGESFIKLNEFLKNQGMITTDILNTLDITYHIDTMTFLALIESNVGLIKQLNQSPSGFMISSQRFGMTNTLGSGPKQQSQGQQNQNLAGKKSNNDYYDSKRKRGQRDRGSSGFFSDSSFRSSYKKFGGK